MSDLTRSNPSPEYSGDQQRVVVSPEAEKLLQEHPDYYTREDTGDLISRLASAERSGVAQVELRVNEQQNLELVIRCLYAPMEGQAMLRRDIHFERTAQGWVYQRKVFFDKQGNEIQDPPSDTTK